MLPGIPAALFMAFAKMLLKASSLRDHALERMIGGVHPVARWQSIPTRASKKLIEKITRGSGRNVRSSSGEREQSDDIAAMAIRWRALRESIF
jgi:hypothetical protein